MHLSNIFLAYRIRFSLAGVINGINYNSISYGLLFKAPQGLCSHASAGPHVLPAIQGVGVELGAIKLKLLPNSNHIFGLKAGRTTNTPGIIPFGTGQWFQMRCMTLPPALVFLSRRIHNSIFHEFLAPPRKIYLGAPFAESPFAFANVFAITPGPFPRLRP